MQSDAVLERLTRLHPKLIDLSLERIERLLAALGHPERELPPVVHVAGTNGKGSVIAFLKAVCEAAGLSAHVYVSPHLIRFNERIGVRGRPIGEEPLNEALAACEEANAGAPITFFEITTAAAFLAFSRVPADIALIETGLGGRFDATNVITAPALSVIHAGLARPRPLPGRDRPRDRLREGGHPEARSPGHDRAAAPGRGRGHRRPGRGHRRAAPAARV